MATLEILTGAAAGQRYEVTPEQTLLGRDPFCDVVLPARSISRQHARIVTESGGYYVEDLHSLNGTFVNGRRIAARTRLNDHDQIQLYEILMTFYEGRPDTSGAAERMRTAAGDTSSEDENRKTTHSTMVVGALDSEVSAALDIGARAKLHAVLEILRNLGRSLDVAVFLPNVLDSLFQIFPQCDRGHILLADAKGVLQPQAVKQRRGEGGSSMTLGPISRTVAKRVMQAGEALLSSDMASEGNVLLSSTSSTMTVPLVGPSRKPLGLMHLESDDYQRPFQREDLEVLLSVGTVTGQAVEYARIHESRLQNDRRQRDLATAREVQLHFLPHARPEIAGYGFFDHYQAAEDVGGDYFGYLKLADGRQAIALGDVSGKGVSAALLMARLCSDVRYCLAISATAVEAVERLNHELSSGTLNDRFVTFLLVVLDPERHTLEVVNAGHLSPLRRRGTNVARLGLVEAGPPLGVDAERRYTAFTTELEPGDTILLYTDGISEARSPDDVIYSTHRLCRLLASGPDTARGLAEHVLADVERVVGGHPQSDDICLVALGRERLV